MATGTSDIYSWLFNPQLYYDPRTQSYRTPGFSQAAYWDDPTPVRAVPEIRADPTVTPTPPETATAALRGVFPSRSNDAGGSQNGGDAGAGLDPLGGYGLAPDGYSIPASDIFNEFTPFGTRDQNLPEAAMGYLLGMVPGMIPGASNVVSRALDFTPGPTAQRDFGRIGAIAQREAEQGLPFSQADDPFAEGDLPNSELGWGLAERAAYEAAGLPTGGRGTTGTLAGAAPAAPAAAPAAAPQVTLAPQTTPFGETITATNTDGQSAKDAQADGGKTGGGEVSASTSAEGGKGDVSASTSADADASKGGDTTGEAGGGDGNGGGIGGQDVGGGPGDSDAGGHGMARGGRVTKRNAVRPGNPPGPDNVYAALQTGETVIPRGVTKGVQAGKPGSAMAALQQIRSGAPAKGKRPIAPRR